MEWDDEMIARLRVLWTEGHSTAEIGRRIGVSKNGIVGKAHRLDLPARPSPIIKNADGTPYVRKAYVPRKRLTLPPLASAEPIVVPPVVPVTPSRAVRPVFVAPPPKPPTPMPYRRVTECCWPIGEPGAQGFRYCGDASDPGAVYCGEHRKLAYVRVRDREVADAAD